MLECLEDINAGSREFLGRLHSRAASGRLPITGGIELTRRCNLRCVHCYLDPEGSARRAREMSTARVLGLLGEVAGAGCLNLLITGGEPLVREDFGEIYVRARELGLLVTVFTNATMVTDEVASLLRETPPWSVEVTLYGATRATYEGITRVSGSFDRCMAGIERLRDTGVPLKLKTILMSLNSHEFYDIEALARRYGLDFRFDAGIFPRLDGDAGPLFYRVRPEEAVKAELSDPKRRMQNIEHLKRGLAPPGQARSGMLYNCGAGLTNFHIDASATLWPCIMGSGAGGVSADLRSGSFKEGWRKLSSLRDLKAPPGHACGDCESRPLCGDCPPFGMLEGAGEGVRSDYMCETGKIRMSAVKNLYQRKVAI